MFTLLTQASVKLVQRYLPSPFIFALLLTFFVIIVGMASTQQSLFAMVNHWYGGLWSLYNFAMQMALILVTGYALARAPIVNRFLDKLASLAKTPGQAIVYVTLVALAACWLNWGFGLIVGAVFARALARQVKGVDYPLLVASAYSGFLIWHGGLSGSIPLALATAGDDLVRLSGGVITEPIGTGDTLFTALNWFIMAGLIIGLPLLNRAMHPKNPTVVDPALMVQAQPKLPERTTPAQKIDDSRLLAWLVLALALIAYAQYFSHNGFALGLNVVIGLFLFLGLWAHRTPERYMRAVEDSIRGIAGIVLLFPFYAGVMGIMGGANAEGVSLSSQITQAFISWSTADTFPVFAFLSAGLVNVFVPSGGGQWAVQGPIMLPAGQALGVSPAVSAMAIAWGDAWTNMIQPFWALPLLGIAGLDARAIMGYCLIILFYAGALIAGAFYLFG
ncbi:MAG: short-chain fatty acid transporter [Neisseriaceae bacterium]|nr:short-chain fatty acid transporter [Neisseriaceae bacterium]MBP6863559.1 short-chain fatty acid transporter [Neisseriaceae bacterium]